MAIARLITVVTELSGSSRHCGEKYHKKTGVLHTVTILALLEVAVEHTFLRQT